VIKNLLVSIARKKLAQITVSIEENAMEILESVNVTKDSGEMIVDNNSAFKFVSMENAIQILDCVIASMDSMANSVKTRNV